MFKGISVTYGNIPPTVPPSRGISQKRKIIYFAFWEIAMENEKSSSGRRFLNTVLFLGNIAMIVWIVLSWQGQKGQQPSDHHSVPGYVASGLSDDGTGTSSGFLAASSSGTSQSTGNADSWIFGGEPSSEPAQSTGGTDSWILGSEPAPSGDPQTAQTGEQTSASYSTSERPEPADFDGWKAHGGAVPSGASVLTDFGAAAGSWKGFIQYDMAEELVSFTISAAQSGADLTVDWYLIHYFGDGSWMNEEDMEDTVFSGSWSDGTLTASGAVNITIRSFYEIGGQQFAVGEMTLADGSAAVVGMVRP